MSVDQKDLNMAFFRTETWQGIQIGEETYFFRDIVSAHFYFQKYLPDIIRYQYNFSLIFWPSVEKQDYGHNSLW